MPAHDLAGTGSQCRGHSDLTLANARALSDPTLCRRDLVRVTMYQSSKYHPTLAQNKIEFCRRRFQYAGNLDTLPARFFQLPTPHCPKQSSVDPHKPPASKNSPTDDRRVVTSFRRPLLMIPVGHEHYETRYQLHRGFATVCLGIITSLMEVLVSKSPQLMSMK